MQLDMKDIIGQGTTNYHYSNCHVEQLGQHTRVSLSADFELIKIVIRVFTYLKYDSPPPIFLILN